jgi:hypothetical protein
MCLGIAEVDQQAIAKILGDVALITADHLGTRGLVGAHHLAPLFRVKLTGEGGGIHEITEEHGELAALGFRCTS